MVKFLDPAIQGIWSDFQHDQDQEKLQIHEERRLIGIPNYGCIKTVAGLHDHHENLCQDYPKILSEFLPDASLQEDYIEGDFIPSFEYNGYDVFVAWNSRSEGPRWDLGQGSDKFTFVLYSEEQRFIVPLLYGNSSNTLAWLAISYVFSREAGEEKEDWLKHLIIDLTESS